MTKKIFHSILLAAVSVLLASLVIIMGCLYDYYKNVQEKQLRDELHLTSPYRFPPIADCRLTWIAAERSRREFAANVSHELKTPLQSIVGSAELLENGLVKQEDVLQFVGMIRTEAARLAALVEDITHLSQLDEGTALEKRSPF